MDGASPFPALTEAMAALREDHDPAADPMEALREAWMRRVLRATLKAGHERVAVVVGAWHAPVLAGPLPPAAADNRTLTGLARRKVSLTWVPWTHSRLASASGYGAGITSPGWYHHLWTAPDQPVTRWLTAVAHVLRSRDLPVSTAHVIDAVRLADSLAALRGRPLAGLAEVDEATRAVLCEGDEVSARYVTDHLVVGERLGAVPDDVPTVPLEADLARTCRSLRIKREATARVVDLDLRKPHDLSRSRLFHRLRLLGIDWATPARGEVRNVGTFRETWSLAWRPELSVALVEAAAWGTTVAAASSARVDRVAATAGLAELTLTLEACLRADLPESFAALLHALDEQAALDADVLHLMEALPALVRAQRYGDVRGTDASALARVGEAMVLRICTALPQAVTSLDDDGAGLLRRHLDAVHAAVTLVDVSADRWLATLAGLVDRADVNGMLVGRMVRLLRDAGRLDDAPVRLERGAVGGGPRVAEGRLGGRVLRRRRAAADPRPRPARAAGHLGGGTGRAGVRRRAPARTTDVRLVLRCRAPLDRDPGPDLRRRARGRGGRRRRRAPRAGGARHGGGDPGGARMTGQDETARRWRLLLGGAADDELGVDLGRDEAAMDEALARLYDEDGTGTGDGAGSGAGSGTGPGTGPGSGPGSGAGPRGPWVGAG